jgi:hypothetical protein
MILSIIVKINYLAVLNYCEIIWSDNAGSAGIVQKKTEISDGERVSA